MSLRIHQEKEEKLMLVNLKEVLKDAEEKHYAVGLFNAINLEMARGVLAAAEESRSPVIIGSAEVLLKYASLEELSSFLLPMAKRASVPVVVHYDHGLTPEKIYRAMELGFTSVMYDCSAYPYRENINRVLKMTELAHSRGITVEGELGHVGDNMSSDDGSIYTQPEQAAEYAEQTGVDALAVAIGTAHGVYKTTPRLDIGRLKEIRGAVSTALVLHGGSGLSDDDFRATIAAGISKINIFTDLNLAAASAAHDGYREGCGMTDLSLKVTETVRQATLRKMEVFGSCGKA